VNDADQTYARKAQELFGEFARPTIKLNPTHQFSDSTSLFQIFLKEEVDPKSKSDDRTSFNDLYTRYCAKCNKLLMNPISKTSFGLQLIERYKRVHSNGSYYLAIKLL
jgi:hypothetical protein